MPACRGEGSTADSLQQSAGSRCKTDVRERREMLEKLLALAPFLREPFLAVNKMWAKSGLF